MPTIITHENDIFYTDHRTDENAVPVILIHGAGGSHLDWPIQLRKLARANALALDLPGHGKSAAPGRESVRAYADAIIAFMDAMNIPQAILCGHSMGGGIAQTCALEFPERVRGLILVGTGAKLRVSPDILDKVRVDQAEVAALLREWIWSPDAPDDLREGALTTLMATPADVVYGDYLACDTFDSRARLAEITAPTLVIGGTEDKMTPHKFSAYLQESIPNAQLVTIQGGGHMMALEYPQIVADAVDAWLKGEGL